MSPMPISPKGNCEKLKLEKEYLHGTITYDEFYSKNKESFDKELEALSNFDKKSFEDCLVGKITYEEFYEKNKDDYEKAKRYLLEINPNFLEDLKQGNYLNRLRLQNKSSNSSAF